MIQEVMKDDIILEVNRFNTNMLINLDEDGSYEENSRQKNSSKNSKSQSSLSTSNDQVCHVIIYQVSNGIVIFYSYYLLVTL